MHLTLSASTKFRIHSRAMSGDDSMHLLCYKSAVAEGQDAPAPAHASLRPKPNLALSASSCLSSMILTRHAAVGHVMAQMYQFTQLPSTCMWQSMPIAAACFAMTHSRRQQEAIQTHPRTSKRTRDDRPRRASNSIDLRCLTAGRRPHTLTHTAHMHTHWPAHGRPPHQVLCREARTHTCNDEATSNPRRNAEVLAHEQRPEYRSPQRLGSKKDGGVTRADATERCRLADSRQRRSHNP